MFNIGIICIEYAKVTVKKLSIETVFSCWIRIDFTDLLMVSSEISYSVDTNSIG